MSETGKIYGVLAAVMSEVGHVGKDRKNPQQGYQFRGIDDVMAHVQPVMAKHGLVCVPRVVEREREVMATKSGGTMASVRLVVDHMFFAPDGSVVVCTTVGEAMDSGDKASNKAMSAALKYALTQTLCIPTYEADKDTEVASPVMGSPSSRQDDLKAKLAASVDMVNRAAAVSARPAASPPRQAAPRVSAGPTNFPNYGKAKGAAIHGASMRDLEFYAQGCRKSLADPAKANWHAKEQALLEAIQDEMARQSGPGDDGPPPPTDADAPPEAF